MLETYRQRGIALVVFDCYVDLLIEEVQNREEVVFFAGVVKGCSVKHIYMVDVNVGVVQQGLQDLDLLTGELVLILSVYLREAVKEGSTVILIHLVDVASEIKD